MWQTPVTQAEFKQIMGKNPAKYKKCGGNCPVENVTWHDAAAFANALSRKHKLSECFFCKKILGNWRCYIRNEFKGNKRKDLLTCKGWRLPTEAEWEYAARAGTRTPYYTGKCLSRRQGQFDGTNRYGKCPTGSTPMSTAPVKKYAPNPWGLYSIHGNVWEWCWDWGNWGLPGKSVVDPVGPKYGGSRIAKGGAWNTSMADTRSASRGSGSPEASSSYFGFRLVRTGP